MKLSQRKAENEIEHGKLLAERDPELTWGWQTPAGRLRAKRRASLIMAGARVGAGKKVLEIGCGTGLFTEMFAQSGAQIIAVDISSELLEIARKRCLPQDRVQFLEKRFEDCVLDGPFDSVIGSSVLHHLELEVALGRIYELLKPGGSISFAEPNMSNPQVFLERKFRRFFPYVSENETAFVRWHFSKLLARMGFEDVEITPFDWLHPATPERLIPIICTVGTYLEKTPIFLEFAGSLYIRGRRPLNS